MKKALMPIMFLLFCVLTAIISVFSCTIPLPVRIFIIAGQSNAVGFGENSDLIPPYDTPQRDVKLWDASTTSWLDLQGGFGKDSDSFGFEVSLGRKLADTIGGDIRIIKVAKSGTGLFNRWLPPNGDLYQELKDTVYKATTLLYSMNANVMINGMFWMQGERDSRDIDDGINPSINYETNLLNLIKSCRKDFNNTDMTFIIGRIHDSLDPSPGNYPYADIVRNAMENVSSEDDSVGIVDTDDFPLMYGAHFNSEGLIELGKAFAAEYINMLAHNEPTT